MFGSLADIRVLEITTSVAGPFATQILGDLGADVIKIERPGRGDDTRGWGPPFLGETSVSFSSLNRNKRSLAIDLKSSRGFAAVEELVRRSDVLVQNLSPGALERLGLTDDRLTALNPGLVYCVITGFGTHGPLAERRAYDPLVQAYGGLMSITGEDGGAPVRVPVSILDKGAAFWAVIGILDGLLGRSRTGRGGRVDVSLFDTVLNWLAPQLIAHLGTGSTPRRHGSGLAGICPYGAFTCEDGYLVVAAANDSLWQRLCDAIGIPELAQRSEFRTNSNRVRNREALERTLNEVFSTQPADSWEVRLDAAGVPNAPVQTVDTVAAHQQVETSGIIESVEHPVDGPMRLVLAALMRDGGRLETRLPPPLLGQHSAEILGEIGLDDSDIEELAAQGVVGVGG